MRTTSPPSLRGAPASAFARVFDVLWARTGNPDANSEHASGFRARLGRSRPAPTATRRQFLAAAGAGFSLLVKPAEATPASMTLAIRRVVGEAEVKPGKVTLNLPPLVENGNTVAMSVTVDSPMTPKDHVKAIHVFTEKNPLPNVISIRLGPRAGKASIATRVRLADTQKVTAVCEMSDGSFWSHTVDVIITLGACLEDTP